MRLYPLILFLLLTSCYTERKAQRQLNKAADRTTIVPKFCLERYPSKVTPGKTITEYLQGDTLVFTDTFIERRNDTVIVNKTVNRYVHDTLRITQHDTVDNGIAQAAYAQCGKDLFASKQSDTLHIEQRNRWIWGSSITWALLLIIGCIRAYTWYQRKLAAASKNIIS